MKAERPSRTAHLVALGRAMADAGLSHVPDFRDPTARVFLNEQGKRSLAKTEAAARGRKRAIGLAAARVMTDLIALRTAAIDKAVGDAIGAGARQLVILSVDFERDSLDTVLDRAGHDRSVPTCWIWEGFVVAEDSGMLDWNRQFAQGGARVERGSYMRIVTARTQPGRR